MAKSEKSHAMLEDDSRMRKARKIIAILKNNLDLKKSKVVDVGTGSGHIALELSKHAKSVDSVDLFDERMIKKGYRFHSVKDEHLPFKDNTFDVAISNHVVEHVPNQNLHLKEIHRVLKPGGVLYLATPNKYWILEPHYKLPFLSWFPRGVCSAYLKIVKGRKWDIYPLSSGDIRRKTKRGFRMNNITLRVIKNPQKYNLDIFGPIQSIMKLIPLPLLRLLSPIVPTHIVLLQKK